MFVRGFFLLIAALLISEQMPNAFLANVVGWAILIVGALYLFGRRAQIAANSAARKEAKAAQRATEDPFARMNALDARMRRAEWRRERGI